MHKTAMNNCKLFFEKYADDLSRRGKVKIIDIGALDVNGSLREVAPNEFEYIGVDFVEGKGVDLILKDPYSLPFESESVDIILSSSCFEHSEMFWIVYLEILRVLKPNGLFYLNVPSNGAIHKYPLDCWRFYPDSGRALVTWAKRNGVNAALLESYISDQAGGIWNDFVAVFLKNEDYVNQFTNRILDKKKDYRNGMIYGSDKVLNQSASPEDRQNINLNMRNIKKKIRNFLFEG